MGRVRSTRNKAEGQARRAEQEASPWIEGMARVGYAAYGVVYVLVGTLAVRAAFGGDSTTSQEGALQTILRAPFGRVLLGLVTVGLLAYAAWRVFQGVRDPENEGKDAKGVVKRFDHVVNGVFHGALAVSAGQLALGSGGGGGGGPDDWTATLLQQPFGRVLVVAVGLVVVGAGLLQFYRATTPSS